jgi:PST family polysaccharide transporter
MSPENSPQAGQTGARRGSIRGLIASFGGQGLCLLIACAQIAVMSRMLPPEMFGVFGMTWAILSLLYYIKDMGLSTAVVQTLREDQQFMDSAFWLSVCGGIGLSAVVVALGPVLGWFYHNHEVAETCYKFAPMFAIGGITSHYQGIMRRRMQFVRLNAVTVIAQCVGTGGAIALAYYGYGIDALVFQTLGQELTCLVLLPMFCNWRPHSFSLRKDAHELLSFGGNLSIFRLVQNLASTMDHVSLGLCTTPAIVGLYNRAQTLLSTPRRQLVLPLSQVMPTLLARLQENEKEFAAASANIVTASSYVWYAFLALIVAVPTPVLDLALGDQWNGAALLMQMLAIGEMARMPLMMINMAETQLGHAKSLRNFGLVSAPITAGGLLLGAWLGGIEHGALYMAMAYAIVQIGLLVMRLIQIRVDTPFTPALMWHALRGPLVFGAALTGCFNLGALAIREIGPRSGLSAKVLIRYGAALELSGALAAGGAMVGLILLFSPKARKMLRGILDDIRGAFRRRK